MFSFPGSSIPGYVGEARVGEYIFGEETVTVTDNDNPVCFLGRKMRMGHVKGHRRTLAQIAYVGARAGTVFYTATGTSQIYILAMMARGRGVTIQLQQICTSWYTMAIGAAAYVAAVASLFLAADAVRQAGGV